MKHKWILVLVICISIIGLTFLFTDDLSIITGAIPSNSVEPVDLKTFDYPSVIEKEDFPRVNVTGVIEDICMLPQLPLWDKAGGGQAGGSIAIAVEGCPGTSMYVTEVQDYGNTTWYHVQKYEERGGLQMYWDGWVTGKVILQGPLPVLVEQ